MLRTKNKIKKDFTDLVLLQKYIENPLLLNKRKFDYRMYILAISTGKEYVYYFNNSIIRMSLFEYDINSRDIWVHTTHSTVVD